MLEMYGILKNLVLMKTTPKETLEYKINRSWAEGNLSDDEKDELLQLVFENLSPMAESPEMSELYKRVAEDLETVKSDIAEIKAEISVLKSGGTTDPGTGETPAPDTEAPAVPEWKPYDAIVNVGYDYGDVVVHNGKYYIDSLSGVKNVWEPGAAGIDERYWIEITKEDAEAVIAGTKTPDAAMGKE